jgi:fatty-acyl-CoA synthase
MTASSNRAAGALSYARGDDTSPVLDRTIGDALRDAAARGGAKTALIEGSADPVSHRRRWSYSALLQDAEKAACLLLRHFHPGERVAICAANSPEWVIAEFGAALAGLVLVTINPALLEQEFGYLLGQARVSGLLVQAAYRGRDLRGMAEALRPRVSSLRKIITMDEWRGLLAVDAPALPLPLVTPDAIAQIQYTSGTTGRPKGAMLTHRGLGNDARFYALAIEAGPDDVWINPMPLFHTAGCGLATLGALQTGGTQILPPTAEPGWLLDLLASERGTHMLCVPTMLVRLLDHPDFNTRDLSSWRLCTLGGAPVAPELVHRLRDRANVAVAIGYGQTEASPYITHTRPQDPHPDWTVTVGAPLPQTELRIVNPATGDILPLGEVGEIQARGYGIMRGYFENADATKAALTGEGWLRTGDLGSLDHHGYCRIHGRLKDLIIRGGENIYPREIEDVLFTHPGIANAAVAGLPDPEWGEIVAAFVQARAGARLDGEQLEAFCRRQLASYKVPRRWYFVDSLPQTASGKVQKYLLQDQAMASPNR